MISNGQVPLTIAIPTFNGSATIERVIKSILVQLDAENIEILISDNCSTDDTEAIIKNICMNTKYSISYYKNESNHGYDVNVDLAVSRSKGEFVWLLSDDDIIEDGSIAKVLGILNPMYSAGFINYFDEALNSAKEKKVIGGSFKSGDDFFCSTHFRSGLISANIVNRSQWIQAGVQEFHGTGWIHFGYLIKALSSGTSFVIAEQYVRQLPREPRWGAEGSFVYVGLRLVTIINQMNSRFGYTKKTQKAGQNIIRGAYWPALIKAKALGLNVDHSLIKLMIKTYFNNPAFWFSDLFLLLIPKPLCKVLYYYGKKTR